MKKDGSGKMSNGFNLEVRGIYQSISHKKKKINLLEDINLSVKRGQFVAIVGCSGAGKTTLMNVLGGYTSPTNGKVFIDNVDYNKSSDIFKGDICYVPQKEILDQTLTLYKSLEYSLYLRVKNMNKKKSKAIIETILKDLELLDKKDNLIRHLSGGEKKRAAIAMEMLTNPALFLLDEPTSGLDSNIEKKVMKKLRSIADTGRTVIITAHTVSNLYLCDKVIFMGVNGRICYDGTYQDIFKYFNVEEFVDIYDILKEDTMTWHDKYKENLKLKEIKEKESISNKNNDKVSFLLQTRVLTKRYINSLFNNKFFCAMVLLQPFVMSILICFASARDILKGYQLSVMVVAAYTLSSVWLGLFTSIQEIVKERDILKKEHMNNLNLASYIASKFIVFLLVCLYQSFVMITITYSIYLNPKPDTPLVLSTYIGLIIQYFLVSFSACTTGIFISSIVKSTRVTLTISPVFMMVQILFSNVFVPLTNMTEPLSNLIIGRWSAEGFGTILNLQSIARSKFVNIDFSTIPSLINSGKNYFSNILFLENANTYYYFTKGHLLNVWFVLLIMVIVTSYLSVVAIKKTILSTNVVN